MKKKNRIIIGLIIFFKFATICSIQANDTLYLVEKNEIFAKYRSNYKDESGHSTTVQILFFQDKIFGYAYTNKFVKICDLTESCIKINNPIFEKQMLDTTNKEWMVKSILYSGLDFNDVIFTADNKIEVITIDKDYVVVNFVRGKTEYANNDYANKLISEHLVDDKKFKQFDYNQTNELALNLNEGIVKELVISDSYKYSGKILIQYYNLWIEFINVTICYTKIGSLYGGNCKIILNESSSSTISKKY